MREITIKVCSIDELNDLARNKAIQEYAKSMEFDATDEKEHYKSILEAIGFDEVKIRYSGFYCQGNGLSFSGKFSKKEGIVRAVKEINTSHDLEMIVRSLDSEVPSDREVEIIFDDSRYCHEYTMTYDFPSDYFEGRLQIGEALLKSSRELSKWFYKQLENDYDRFCSDEYVMECIRANNYEYLEDGTLFTGVKYD